jgi:hypothetical protein
LLTLHSSLPGRPAGPWCRALCQRRACRTRQTTDFCALTP